MTSVGCDGNALNKLARPVQAIGIRGSFLGGGHVCGEGGDTCVRQFRVSRKLYRESHPSPSVDADEVWDEAFAQNQISVRTVGQLLSRWENDTQALSLICGGYWGLPRSRDHVWIGIGETCRWRRRSGKKV